MVQIVEIEEDEDNDDVKQKQVWAYPFPLFPQASNNCNVHQHYVSLWRRESKLYLFGSLTCRDM